MRLGPEQLNSSLSRSPLKPIYLISGDEPLQVMECADSVRRQAREQGFSERVVFDDTTGFEWNSLLEAVSNLSLFSERRLLELRLGKSRPGKEGGAVLIRYCEQSGDDSLLIITADRLDKKSQQSKWYKTIDNTGVTVQVWPIAVTELPAWIQKRVREKGMGITTEAASLLAERVEGNLLAANQEIKKLCLLVSGVEIDIHTVASAVADSTRFDVFDMITSALSGNAARAVRMLHGLSGEGADPAAILGAMLWEYRRLNRLAWNVENGAPLDKLFAEYRIWDKKRKHAIKLALKRYNREKLNILLRSALKIDKTIKSSDRDLAWNQLQLFLLSLSGKRSLPFTLDEA